MFHEGANVLLVLCVIALANVVGNKIALWNNWFMCAAGAFTNVVLLNLVVTPTPFVDGLLMAGFAALLWWIGHEIPH